MLNYQRGTQESSQQTHRELRKEPNSMDRAGETAALKACRRGAAWAGDRGVSLGDMGDLDGEKMEVRWFSFPEKNPAIGYPHDYGNSQSQAIWKWCSCFATQMLSLGEKS